MFCFRIGQERIIERYFRMMRYGKNSYESRVSGKDKM